MTCGRFHSWLVVELRFEPRRSGFRGIFLTTVHHAFLRRVFLAAAWRMDCRRGREDMGTPVRRLLQSFS